MPLLLTHTYQSKLSQPQTSFSKKVSKTLGLLSSFAKKLLRIITLYINEIFSIKQYVLVHKDF